MSSKLSPDRELQRLITLAQKQGWKILIRNNGHLKWSAPNGYCYYSARTPSDGRAIKNIKAALVRHGALVVAD